VLGPELLVRRPWWLADGQRGWGVPEHMHWRPLVTFIQTAMDAANAMVSVPGEFGSFGHDDRADMVRFVRDACPARRRRRPGGHPPTGPAAARSRPGSRCASAAPAAPAGSEDDRLHPGVTVGRRC
jgi:hypothetical protein